MGISMLPLMATGVEPPAPSAPTTTPDAQTVARIQQGIGVARAKGYDDATIDAYLQKRFGVRLADFAGADPNIGLRNVARSLGQGASFGFSDELTGLAKGSDAERQQRIRQKLFQAAHPVVDAASKIVGGLAAPLVAAAAAPEGLVGGAGLGGAALVGAAAGGAQGVGEGETAQQRAIGGTLGAAGGGLTAGLLHGAGKLGAAALQRFLDGIDPARAVARAAAPLLPANAATLADRVNELAPGGASVATVAPNLLPFARGIGASPEAAADAASALARQRAVLNQAKTALGDQYDALQRDIPVDDQLKAILPGLRDAVPELRTNLGETVDFQTMKSALSDIRTQLRKAIKAENGNDIHTFSTLEAQLKGWLADRVPEFTPIDQNYALVKGQLRAVKGLQRQVDQSASNYGANRAYGASSGSLGGSLPRSAHGVVSAAADKLLAPDRAARAAAAVRLLLQPADGSAVSQVAGQAPVPPGLLAALLHSGVSATGGLTQSPLRGLLSMP